MSEIDHRLFRLQEDLAESCAKLGDFESALAAAEKALEVNSHSSELSYFAAVYAACLGEREKAKKYLAIARELDPEIETQVEQIDELEAAYRETMPGNESGHP